jgi:hypothetical protein
MTQLSSNLLSYQQLLIKVARLINVVNSKGIFSKEEIASEYSTILTEVQQQMGAPLTQYDPFIKGEPPMSSKVNLFFEGSTSDINVAAGQIDALNAKSISVFNLFTKEIENEKRFSERIASKAKVLQMYSKSPADDIFYVGDSFDNDDSIDYSRIQAGFNPLIKNGIMSLSVSATQKWNANLVKVLSSRGFIGNSHQVVRSLDAEQSSDYKYVFENSATLNNLTSIKDSNPLSYFEYEALNVDKDNASPKPSIPARQNEFKYLKSEFSSSRTGEGDLLDWSNHPVDEPLVLDLELASSSSALANSIDITPYFGSMKYVEVSSVIVYGKDGASEQILKSPIYIGSSLVPLNLQMAKSYFYNKATIRFSERQVFKIQASFRQPEYSNIDIQHLYWKPTTSNRNNPFVNLERFNPDALSKDIYEKVEYNKYNLLPTQSNPTEYSKLGTAFKTVDVSIKKKPVARKFYVIELTLTSPLDVQRKVYFERWDSSFQLGTRIIVKEPFFLSSIEYSEDEIKNKNYETMEAAQKDFDELMQIYMSDPENPTKLEDESTVDLISVVEQSFTAQEKTKNYRVAVQSAKERYPAKRWCIGLRDIEVYKETFNSQLEIVSLPFNFDFPVESAMLSIDSNIDEAMLKNISLLGYISVDGGNNWIQISPIQLDFSGIPEVLFFNQSVLNEYRLSGASYLTYPAVPREVKNILVKIKITKKNRLNFTPSIYSYQLIAKVKRS